MAASVSSSNTLHRLWPRLLPRTALVRTGYCDDEPGLNWHPLLAVIARLRFYIILSLLPDRRYARLLEIGYGSGIFQPELSRHCDALYGLDIHPFASQVWDRLQDHRVHTALTRGSGTALPFSDNSFDCVVAMSCLEYMDPVEHVALEIRRILRPDGCFVFVTPGTSPLIDRIHDRLTGRRVKESYGDRRNSLIATFTKHFVIEEQLTSPRIGGSLLTLYRGMRLVIN